VLACEIERVSELRLLVDQTGDEPPVAEPPVGLEALPHRLHGYDRRATAELVEGLRLAYERLWDERRSLQEQVAKLETELAAERRLAQTDGGAETSQPEADPPESSGLARGALGRLQERVRARMARNAPRRG